MLCSHRRPGGLRLRLWAGGGGGPHGLVGCCGGGCLVRNPDCLVSIMRCSHAVLKFHVFINLFIYSPWFLRVRWRPAFLCFGATSALRRGLGCCAADAAAAAAACSERHCTLARPPPEMLLPHQVRARMPPAAPPCPPTPHRATASCPSTARRDPDSAAPSHKHYT
jgi:hypothetical protein